MVMVLGFGLRVVIISRVLMGIFLGWKNIEYFRLNISLRNLGLFFLEYGFCWRF